MTARAIILRRRFERRAQRTSAATITVNCRALGKAMHRRLLVLQKAERAERRRERRQRERAALGCLLRLVATARRPGRAKLLSPRAKWADARAAELTLCRAAGFASVERVVIG